MATAEGTLVASYNRGMKLVREAGGVKTTVLADAMQRAPAFLFGDAREARTFAGWLDEHFDEIKEAAESTTKSGRLQDIEKYSASRILYTRFNYTTGDAAGQNLSGKATAAACAWISDNYPGIEHFFLESNFATDKKTSQVNMLNTRGKRVVAEATISNELMERHMHASTDLMFKARQVSNLGGFMSGVNNNGGHSANGPVAQVNDYCQRQLAERRPPAPPHAPPRRRQPALRRRRADRGHLRHPRTPVGERHRRDLPPPHRTHPIRAHGRHEPTHRHPTQTSILSRPASTTSAQLHTADPCLGAGYLECIPPSDTLQV